LRPFWVCIFVFLYNVFAGVSNRLRWTWNKKGLAWVYVSHWASQDEIGEIWVIEKTTEM
jgi:hypothetical protein